MNPFKYSPFNYLYMNPYIYQPYYIYQPCYTCQSLSPTLRIARSDYQNKNTIVIIGDSDEGEVQEESVTSLNSNVFKAKDLIPEKTDDGRIILSKRGADFYEKMVGNMDQLAKKKCIQYCNNTCHKVCVS
ncbi:hypothetical protein [Bacillus weihaiensis]|uniref:hypothetical protein n=1 Tax=Bacillus weihaiensis TaxID=1547283 RepID=UPI002353F29E|nr:hypothetical protein [Bacillus weihaiensis]